MWFRNGILTLLACGTFLCLGQSNLSFKKVKLVGKTGGSENAELAFLSDRKVIAIRDSHETVINIPYDKIARMSYGRTERTQTAKEVAVGAMTYGLGALLIPKVPQYHLFIDYEEQGSSHQVEVLLSDRDWVQVVRHCAAGDGQGGSGGRRSAGYLYGRRASAGCGGSGRSTASGARASGCHTQPCHVDDHVNAARRRHTGEWRLLGQHSIDAQDGRRRLLAGCREARLCILAAQSECVGGFGHGAGRPIGRSCGAAVRGCARAGHSATTGGPRDFHSSGRGGRSGRSGIRPPRGTPRGPNSRPVPPPG